MDFLLMKKIFWSSPNGVLTSYTEVPARGAAEAFQSHLCSTQKIVGVGGCVVIIAWWQNTSYTSLVPRLLCKAAHTREPGNEAIAAQARCTGFNSRLLAFFTFLYFHHLITVYRTYF